MNLEFLDAAYNAKKYYAVYFSGGIPMLYVESPDEQGLTNERLSEESLVRLFVSKEDAEVYCELVQVVHGDVDIQELTLVDLWKLIPNINLLSFAKFEVPVRVSFCLVGEEGWIDEVDTVYSKLASIH